MSEIKKPTIQECIKFLDKKIKREQSVIDDLEDGMIEKTEDYVDITIFTEIKEKLEQQVLPDEELVEKIMDLVKKYFPRAFNNPIDYPGDYDNLKVEIRSLLQSRKPKITKEEIYSLCLSLSFNSGTLTWKADKFIELLKSKDLM